MPTTGPFDGVTSACTCEDAMRGPFGRAFVWMRSAEKIRGDDVGRDVLQDRQSSLLVQNHPLSEVVLVDDGSHSTAPRRPIWAIDLQRFDVAGTVRGPLVDGQTVSGG
jgi:hypothetical protein